LEDYESVINMLHHGYNGVVIPEVLFYYRVRSGSMFRSVSVNKLLYSNKYIVEKHVDYYSKFATQIINLLNSNGPGYYFDNPTLEVSVKTSIKRPFDLEYKLKSFVKRSKRLKKIALSLRNKLK